MIITEQDINDYREKKVTQAKLAKKYGTYPVTMGYHLRLALGAIEYNKISHRFDKLTIERVEAQEYIDADIKNEVIDKIVDKYGCSRNAVWKIVMRTLTKVCPKCNNELNLLKFNKDASRNSGLSCWCKKCKQANRRQRTNKKAIEQGKFSKSEWGKILGNKNAKVIIDEYKENPLTLKDLEPIANLSKEDVC